MPHTISILSRKGGSGRTTLTFNLGGYFAKSGVRVLCIDLDGQASLSRAFLGSEYVESLRPADTAAGLFLGNGQGAIHATAFENLHVIPAGDSLEQFATPNRRDFGQDQYAISELLRRVGSDYDVVLIDNPPNTSVATVWAGLVAADYVLSPVPADAFGVQSIASVLNLVAAASQYNPRVALLGYVLSAVQRNKVSDAYRAMLTKLHGGQVFNSEIAHATVFRESITERKPLSHYRPKGKPAQSIGMLADEIVARAEAINSKGLVA